jgi:oxazoline/thiazoline dehydrogenase
VIQLSLQADVALSRAEPGLIIVQHPTRGSAQIQQLDSGVEEAVLRLAGGPVSRDDLRQTAIAANPTADLVRLDLEVARLARWSLVEFSCVFDGEVTLVAILTSELASFDFQLPDGGERLRLSRFAYLRRLGEDLVLESPRSFARVAVRVPAVAGLLVALTSPRTLSELHGATVDCGREVVNDCVRVLVGVRMVGAVDAAGKLQEERDAQVAQREFHDVLLHSRSRCGLTDQTIGGVYPYLGVIPPAPALKPVMSASPLPLPRPDLDRIVKEDPPLAKVMEERRSIRRYGRRQLTVEELGEFMFRVARVRAVRPADPEAMFPYESSDRTYPSGGATYDLECYVTVRACRGLPPGIYHYEPLEHALSPVCDQPKLVIKMLNEAYWASGRSVVPQVLITLASRFARLSWKYQGIAYALTLKNVGVLYEAMYLAATAMSLAPCALGAGNSATFSKATGLDPSAESSVGEFMLGTLP